MSTQTPARILHDLGAAAWFGGALMGATGLRRAGGAAGRQAEDVGWRAWQPWKGAAIAAHVAGSVGLLWGNKARLLAQKDAMVVNAVKTGVFLAAVGADVAAARLGDEVGDQQATGDAAVRPVGDDDPAGNERRLRLLQWAVVVLTGANVALGSQMGEQQRPTNLLGGLMARFDPRR